MKEQHISGRVRYRCPVSRTRTHFSFAPLLDFVVNIQKLRFKLEVQTQQKNNISRLQGKGRAKNFGSTLAIHQLKQVKIHCVSREGKNNCFKSIGEKSTSKRDASEAIVKAQVTTILFTKTMMASALSRYTLKL